jgi:hypothetical protein
MTSTISRSLSRTIALFGAAVCCAASAAIAADPQPSAAKAEFVRATADLIDTHIFSRLKETGVPPSERSDDAEFLRRVWLDLAGKVPPVMEVRDFLATDDPDKRRRVVDELLASSRHVVHFTTYWRSVLVPEANNDGRVRLLLPGFEAWLRERLANNTPYDDLVREMLTHSLTTPEGRGMTPQRAAGEVSPVAFYQAKEIAPENLAAATARIFLGMRIDCAQCHDHPFDQWKQEQFWSYAAFFAGIERQGDQGVFGPVQEVFDRRELRVPNTTKVVQAGYLDGTEPRWRTRIGSRETLAAWMTSPDNPYFTRAAVNRVWGKLFGVGLVDPVDDFGQSNPCSHPELLTALAEQFAAQDVELQFLIRAITTSRAYQRSSRRTHESQDQPGLFARMATKGLTPEQLYDSLAQATGTFEPYVPIAPMGDAPQDARSAFLELFANDTDPITRQQATVLQALALMNGRGVSAAVDVQQSRALRAVCELPLSTAERVEALFLATLSRPPREDERQRCVTHVERSGTPSDKDQALADVLWALLNCNEFQVNH